MPVSFEQELEERKKIAEDRLSELEQAYANFIRVWKTIEEDEFALLKQVHAHVDQKKLHTILKDITNFNA